MENSGFFVFFPFFFPSLLLFITILSAIFSHGWSQLVSYLCFKKLLLLSYWSDIWRSNIQEGRDSWSDNMFVQLLMALLLGSLVACLAFYHSHARDANNPAQGEDFYHGQRIMDPQLCHRLIAGKSLSDNHRNMLQPLGSRAEDNGRLVDAFNIDNAFTSADEVYVKHFVKEAQSRISLTSEQWKDISGLAQYAVRGWINSSQSVSEHESPMVIRIKLASMVQAVCLRVVLKILFKIEKEAASDDRLVSLAEAINRVWIASKTQEGSRYGQDRDLQNALSAVFPDVNIFEPRENPLNFILPAFETLWRTVLRTFVEVKFTTGSKNPEWQISLLRSPGTQPRISLSSKRLHGKVFLPS